MNEYETNYLKYYDLRYSLIQKVKSSFMHNHTSTRKCASMESRNMFEKFKGSILEETDIDISHINQLCVGSFIVHPLLQNFNKIKITGPKQLVDKFINQIPSDRKVNIFINSVKPIPGTNLLWDMDFIQKKTKEDQELNTYPKFEQPFTQQYCNYYEFFENIHSNYNYDDRFIVIITTQKMYNAYRELYPHFLICV